MSATQRNIVLWMNAADGALAIARPEKNSRNDTAAERADDEPGPIPGTDGTDLRRAHDCHGDREQ